MKILVVEDNRSIVQTLIEYFEGRGNIVDVASDGVKGFTTATTSQYDVIVLDLMLPKVDGLELCRRLRYEAEINTPILMLTARDTLEDKLKGFDCGADDYLVKPFSLAELEARLKVLARRAGSNLSGILKIGPLEMDASKHLVFREGRSIDLTPIGKKILLTLMRAYPAVVSRREIEHAVWGESVPDSDALRSHLHTLRQALDKSFSEPLIQTVHGVGIRLNVPKD